MIKKMAPLSRATMFRRLDDLEVMGILESVTEDGKKLKTGEHGTRLRRINIEPLQRASQSAEPFIHHDPRPEPEKGKAKVSIETSDKGKSKSQIEEPKSHLEKTEVSDRKLKSQIEEPKSQILCETQPSYQPSSDRPFQTDQPTAGLDGWLALLPKILEEETGMLYRMTGAEADRIRHLGSIYGPIPVLAAFYQFTQRPEGFAGLVRPFSVFAGEVDRWIAKAHTEAAELADTIRAWKPDRERQFLAELGDAKLGEDVRQLLVSVWAGREELLNRDMLAQLVSEQMSREPAALSV